MGLSLSKRESKVLNVISLGYFLGLPALAYYTYGKKRTDPFPPFGLIGYLLVLGAILTFTFAAATKYILKGEVKEGAFRTDGEGNKFPVYKKHALTNLISDYWYLWSMVGAGLIYIVFRLIFGKNMYQTVSYLGNLGIYLAAYIPFVVFISLPLVLDVLPLENKDKIDYVGSNGVHGRKTYLFLSIGIVLFAAVIYGMIK